MSISQNIKPKLAGKKIVFENRRILGVFEDRRSCCTRTISKQFDEPDDVVLHAQIQDQGLGKCS